MDAICKLETDDKGRSRFIVEECPFCTKRHSHGAPIKEPNRTLGTRLSLCANNRQYYNLVLE